MTIPVNNLNWKKYGDISEGNLSYRDQMNLCMQINLFTCPHPTGPEFGNQQVFFFFVCLFVCFVLLIFFSYIYPTKEADPKFGKSW